jgi:hypothetical protein
MKEFFLYVIHCYPTGMLYLGILLFGIILIILSTLAECKKNRPTMYIGVILFALGIVGTAITVHHSLKEISGFKYQELIHNYKTIYENDRDVYREIKQKYGSKISNMKYCTISYDLEKQIQKNLRDKIK